MRKVSKKAVPDGYHGITPYLIRDGAAHAEGQPAARMFRYRYADRRRTFSGSGVNKSNL